MEGGLQRSHAGWWTERNRRKRWKNRFAAALSCAICARNSSGPSNFFLHEDAPKIVLRSVSAWSPAENCRTEAHRWDRHSSAYRLADATTQRWAGLVAGRV